MSEIGEILRRAREKKGASLAQAAAATRIKPSYLEAMENGEYGLLPGAAYTAGFLRNYASYLGLHPDDVVQEYHARRPLQQPIVKPATRVLAHGHERRNRSRLLWTFTSLIVLIACAFAVKQYNDSNAHASAPPISVTPAILGANLSRPHLAHKRATTISLRLESTAPVWVRVSVDGRRAFQGILQAHFSHAIWTGHHGIYVVTTNGRVLSATLNGKPVGLLARKKSIVVGEATPAGWRRIS